MVNYNYQLPRKGINHHTNPVYQTNEDFNNPNPSNQDQHNSKHLRRNDPSEPPHYDHLAEPGYSFQLESRNPQHVVIERRNPKTAVIVGSGDLGRALLMCLVRAKYTTIVATRDPERHRTRIESMGGIVESYERAFAHSDLILVAIPFEGFSNLPANLLAGKIVIDVSNRPLKYKRSNPSLAEQLQELLPSSKVVKAFNTLSAYALQNGMVQGSKEIPICSDDDQAKVKVMTLAQNLGFNPVDKGALSNAKSIEDIPMAFFVEWQGAAITAIVIYFVCLIYLTFRLQLCDNFAINKGDKKYGIAFAYFPVVNISCAFALTAIMLLSSCYMPGVIASYMQMRRGTKYSQFPSWLDKWMKSRKQLGILTLYCATVHFVLIVIDYGGPSEIWRNSMIKMTGVLSLSFMTVLGITSLPSVAASLTWREFSFVQRYLGWWCLFLAFFHLIFNKWHILISNSIKCQFLPDESQLIIWAPLLTIVGKLPLLLPCVDTHLQMIRRGQEFPRSRR